MPTLDADARRLVDLGRQAGKPPFEVLTPVQAREAYAASWDLLQPPAEPVASVRDIDIDGPGGVLRLRVYRGTGTAAGQCIPCLVFLHGGGWVIGGLESHDRLCRNLANAAGICVVAVDYRLAPEFPYPAGLDDCEAAWRWVHQHTAELSIEPERIAIGGDSAGGHHAAVLALMGRDGTVPAACHQTLLYPVTDIAAESDSYRSVADVPLTAATMRWFIDLYAPDPAARAHWKLSPLRAASFAGLPPALLLTVGHDPLRDEGRAYGERLHEAGVQMLSLHAGDQMHGVLLQGRMVRAANVLAEMLGTALRAALRPVAN
ncbi:alpha/beta hydrolase [Piscinibacter sakaiensis]|uniref:alpha/beta hydrolase n=1 Tax=Piscinibacter sakaiensis TaxID=1547922 RepID=UPI003AAA5D48